MEPREPGDLTPETGAETDIAPLGRSAAKPAHELTATEDGDRVRWELIAALPEFQALVKAKLRFIVRGTALFVSYYLLLLVLVGYFPELMKREVLGSANIAYLFGLSQFFMAWILAGVYVRVAAGWDRMAEGIMAKTAGR